MHLLTKSSIWHCSFSISLQFLVKKDMSSFRHYLSFLHNFYNCIITIPRLFFELHCCCVTPFNSYFLPPIIVLSIGNFTYKFSQLNCQLFWISLTEWSVILELLLVPVSLQRFHIDNSLYTSNLELRLQLTSYLNNFLILLYLLWHWNLKYS